MKQQHVPLRMCAGCRQMRPQTELLRIVKECQTGEVLFDLNKKKFGRGIYLCKNKDCLRLARKKHALERQFKTGAMQKIYDKAEEFISQ